LLFLKKSDTAF